MMTHVVACFWIITGKFDMGEGWYAEMEGETSEQLYLTSFYFTITTITTVGYGDISASTFLEKIMAISMMLLGVIAFSFASGTLTNYIQEEET